MTPPRRRRLYRSLDGRLGRTKAQHDTLHRISNINEPISVLKSRKVIDARIVWGVDQKCEQRWLNDYHAF